MTTPTKKEEVKRLQPTGEVLRELFLKSGNLCAFPGCIQPIMDKDGRFVGQICHIEAAEEGGERFNAERRNEERRAFSNLMLLCYPHHVETNNVAKFDVQRMKEMKASHEQKVYDFIERTLLNVADQTKLSNPRPARNCSRLNRVLGCKRSPEVLAEDATCFNGLLTNLSQVPLPARKLLVVILERAATTGGCHDMVLASEVQIACCLDTSTMEALGKMLEKYGLIDIGEPDDDGDVRLLPAEWNGCPVWDDLRGFVKAGHGTLRELVEDLNFSLLDEPPH